MELPVGVTLVRAPNPGPLTLDGTNTWLLHGAGTAIIVDPGPLLDEHVAAVLAAASGFTVTAVVLTHNHADHSAAARTVADAVQAPVLAADPELADVAFSRAFLADGHGLCLGDHVVTVIATPGHTSDSLSLLNTSHNMMVTGDTVLGRGTALVAYPDGHLGDYLLSLERLRALIHRHDIRRILPGHGPVVTDPAGVLDHYLEHRQSRIEGVRAARDAGAAGVDDIVASVYADVDPSLWPAAALTVRATLAYLDA